jgi:hypothetical protein
MRVWIWGGLGPFCPLLLLSSPTHHACITPRRLLPLRRSFRSQVESHISHTDSPISPPFSSRFPLFIFFFLPFFSSCCQQGREDKPVFFCSYYFPFVFALVTSSGRNFVYNNRSGLVFLTTRLSIPNVVVFKSHFRSRRISH